MEGVGQVGCEGAARGEGAAGMPIPDFLRQDVDEPDPIEYGALIERIRPEKAVDIVGPEVCDHFRWRHRADLDIGVGVEPGLGDIVAQQVVMHRIVEGNSEFQTLPLRRVALVLVLQRESDRLAVDVFDCRHRPRLRCSTGAKRDRERHRRQHVRGVVFLV